MMWTCGVDVVHCIVVMALCSVAVAGEVSYIHGIIAQAK